MITNIILSLWNIQPHLWGSAFNCDRWIFKSSKTAMNNVFINWLIVQNRFLLFTSSYQFSEKFLLHAVKHIVDCLPLTFLGRCVLAPPHPWTLCWQLYWLARYFVRGGGFLFPSPVCISAITLCLRQCLSFSEISFQFCVQLQQPHLAWRLMWQLAPLFLSSYLQNSRPAVLFIRRV